MANTPFPYIMQPRPLVQPPDYAGSFSGGLRNALAIGQLRSQQQQLKMKEEAARLDKIRRQQFATLANRHHELTPQEQRVNMQNMIGVFPEGAKIFADVEQGARTLDLKEDKNISDAIFEEIKLDQAADEFKLDQEKFTAEQEQQVKGIALKDAQIKVQETKNDIAQQKLDIEKEDLEFIKTSMAAFKNEDLNPAQKMEALVGIAVRKPQLGGTLITNYRKVLKDKNLDEKIKAFHEAEGFQAKRKVALETVNIDKDTSDMMMEIAGGADTATIEDLKKRINEAETPEEALKLVTQLSLYDYKTGKELHSQFTKKSARGIIDRLKNEPDMPDEETVYLTSILQSMNIPVEGQWQTFYKINDETGEIVNRDQRFVTLQNADRIQKDMADRGLIARDQIDSQKIVAYTNKIRDERNKYRQKSIAAVQRVQQLIDQSEDKAPMPVAMHIAQNHPEMLEEHLAFLRQQELDKEKIRSTKFNNTQSLVAAYDRENSDFFEMQRMFKRLKTAYINPSGQSDIAMIYLYQKLLDSRGAVRKGEYQLSAGASSKFDKMQLAIEEFVKNKKLGKQSRHDIYKAVQGFLAEDQKTHRKSVRYYKQRAEDAGLDKNVIRDRSLKDIELSVTPQEIKPRSPAGFNSKVDISTTGFSRALDIARQKNDVKFLEQYWNTGDAALEKMEEKERQRTKKIDPTQYSDEELLEPGRF